MPANSEFVCAVAQDHGKSHTYTFNVWQDLIPKEAPYLNKAVHESLVVQTGELGIESDHA